MVGGVFFEHGHASPQVVAVFFAGALLFIARETMLDVLLAVPEGVVLLVAVMEGVPGVVGVGEGVPVAVVAMGVPEITTLSTRRLPPVPPDTLRGARAPPRRSSRWW